ncbi:MAG TPA: methionine--tRNA ligase [Chloroflexota bacterium]
MERHYLTTAIPYVNARPHLGFALELVQADALARYRRRRGAETRLLTGTDDNSLSNVLAAERAGVPVAEFVESSAAAFRDLAARLEISHDDFIRTATDQRHLAGARALWQACLARGDIYRRHYRGLYCVGCECFYDPDELVDGRCPEHLTVPEEVEEENYFFRLSRYQGELERLLDSGELRIVPAHRGREVRAFVARGLRDFSISRSHARAHGWGIPVPGDTSGAGNPLAGGGPDQVIYVWFDALTNYISALGYGGDDELYRRYWLENPNRLHVIGKGILRFHAVHWPAMLLSAGQPPPRTILVHGYLTRDGRKLSKSLGNTIDPFGLIERWGAEAVRYWLLREVTATEDADYTDARFEAAYVAGLANDLGNLVNRTVSLLGRCRDGVVPAPGPEGEHEAGLRASAAALGPALEAALGDALDPPAGLRAVFELVGAANRYAEATAPWRLAGDPAATARLDSALWSLAEAVRVVGEALAPFLPATSAAILAQLGLEPAGGWPASLAWGRLRPGTRAGQPQALFPRPARSDREARLAG